MHRKTCIGMIVLAGFMAGAPAALAQQSSDGWNWNVGLDLNWRIGNDVSFDRSATLLNDIDFSLNDFELSFELPEGEYNSGYVYPGSGGGNTTENWGADFEAPSSSLDRSAGTITLGRTSYTRESSYTFSNVASGSATDSGDHFMPMLRIGATAPRKPGSNFEWGLFGGFGYGRIDASSGRYRGRDIAGGDTLHFTTDYDTYQVASGLDDIPDHAYYGEPGINGPTIFFNPISTRTETYSDFFSGTGYTEVEQELELDMFELRFGAQARWHFDIDMKNSVVLGVEGGPSLVIAHGKYSIHETLYANTHGIERTFEYSDSDSSTKVLPGLFAGASALWQTQLGDMPFDVGVRGGYSWHTDFDLGAAEVDGGAWEVGLQMTLHF